MEKRRLARARACIYIHAGNYVLHIITTYMYMYVYTCTAGSNSACASKHIQEC